MTYLLIGIISFIYYNVSNRVYDNRSVFFSLLFFLWILVLGFQYNVGTDYHSYRFLYNTDKLEIYRRKGEFGFYYLIKMLRVFKNPQIIFIAISSIQTILTFHIFEKYRLLGFKQLHLMVFCYFAVSGIFMNQLNGLRIFIAMLIFNLSFFSLFEKKYLKLILQIFIAGLFHRSIYFISLFYFFVPFFKKKWSLTIYAFCILIPLFVIPLSNFVRDTLLLFVPGVYRHYIGSYYAVSQDTMTLITKLIYLPLYLLSLVYLKKQKYNSNQWFLIKIGYFSSSLYAFTAPIRALGRVVNYFDFFKIIPIYILLCSIHKKKNIYLFFLIFMYLMIPFLAKITILASGEYKYDSILYHINELEY